MIGRMILFIMCSSVVIAANNDLDQELNISFTESPQNLTEAALREEIREELRLEMELLLEQRLATMRKALKKELMNEFRKEFSQGAIDSPYKTKQGTFAAEISLSNNQGTLLTKTALIIKKIDRRKRLVTEVGKAVTNEQGKAVVVDLPAGETLYVYAENRRGLGMVDTRDLEAGTVIKSKVILPPKAPEVGELVPEIELVDTRTQKKIKLSDYRGQIVFLEFWATWDASSQRSMARAQKLMSEQDDQWEGRVAVMAVSIDDTLEALKTHLEDKGWDRVLQFWSGLRDKGLSPAQIFAVKGIPSAFLIDVDGKLVWKGDPSSYQVEEQINELLKNGSP